MNADEFIKMLESLELNDIALELYRRSGVIKSINIEEYHKIERVREIIRKIEKLNR